MSRRTNTYNGWNSTLASQLLPGGTTFDVLSAAGIVAPTYLVIDWDDPFNVEWVKIDSVAVDTLTCVGGRGLTGSVGDTHAIGAKIRAVMSKQALDDIFQDIEDIETSDGLHAADGAAHHAVYTDGEAEAAITAQDIYYTKTEIDALLASYYTLDGWFPTGC